MHTFAYAYHFHAREIRFLILLLRLWRFFRRNRNDGIDKYSRLSWLSLLSPFFYSMTLLRWNDLFSIHLVSPIFFFSTFGACHKNVREQSILRFICLNEIEKYLRFWKNFAQINCYFRMKSVQWKFSICFCIFYPTMTFYLFQLEFHILASYINYQIIDIWSVIGIHCTDTGYD